MVRPCPECGGEMYFDRRRFTYVCRNCGLALGRFEIYKYGKRKAEKREEDWRKEYLKWWLSSKK